jgi:replicative DNA helicase
VLAQFAALDRELRLVEAPEGDMRTEAAELMGLYNDRALAAQTRRGVVSTGFAAIDRALGGGLWPGELDLIAAYTNGGKTSLAVHLAWHACVIQGKNVVIFTSETLRTQIRFKLIARHSVYLLQAAAERGIDAHGAAALNSKAIKEGALPDLERRLLHDTITHFANTPAHGRCYIAQVSRGATIGTLESRLARITRMFPADLVIIDYLALLRPGVKRQTRREELAETVVEAKAMATTYLDGRGVPVVSPWQINRAGWEEAKKEGRYTTAHVAETAEASSTSDTILTLLDDEPDRSNGRAAPVQAQLIKVRDGEKLGSPLLLTADFGTCHFTLRQRATTEPAEDIEALASLEEF